MRTIKKLIFFINILFAVALLLAFASPHISPKVSYVPQMFALIYKPLLLFNLFFVVIWWFWQRKKAIFSLLTCLLFLLYAPRLYHAIPSNNTQHKSGVSLISYNVKSFSKSSKNKKENIFSFLKEQDADIICFQEYNNRLYKKAGQKLLKRKYPYSQINKKKRETAIFSKYPIIYKKDISFDMKHHCSGILSDVVVDKDTVRILNVHLQSNSISVSNQTELERIVSNEKHNYKVLKHISSKIYHASKKRLQQVQILRELIAASPYKVILCGDFNDTPLSYAYELISKDLSDSFAKKGYGSGATYQRGIIDVRIDYVFSKFKTLDFQVLTVPYSDHFPIKVILKLRKKTP